MLLKFPKEFAKFPDYRVSPVAHQVPLATVRDRVYVLTDGSMAAVFRVRGMEYDLAGARETAQFCEAVRGTLNSLPAGVQLKFLHRITNNYRDLLEEHEGLLDSKNSFARYVAWDGTRRWWRSMERSELLRSDNLFVITYNPRIAWWGADNKAAALEDTIKGLLSPGKVARKAFSRYRMALEKFEQIVRPVVDQMRFANLRPERLDNDGLYGLAWELLNPTASLTTPAPRIRPPHPDDPYAGLFAGGQMAKLAKQRPDLTVVVPPSEREQLCVSDWSVGDKWVRIDDRYFGVVTLKMLPAAVYPSMALALASMPFEATISVDAVMLQKQKEMERQWAEARSEESKAQATMFGARADPAKMAAAQDKQEAYMQLASPYENPFRFRLSVVVSAPNPKLLTARCETVVTLMRNMEGAVGLREHYAVDTALKMTWPFHPITDMNCRKALTSQISDMMPVFDRWAGSKRPVTLFMDRMQRLVKHDPFPSDQLNRNKVLTGKSGSGKSFGCQLADIQPHLARDGVECLIVESGGSFKLTTECFGGKFIKLGPACEYTINAFDLPTDFMTLPDERKTGEISYKSGFIKNLVLAIAKVHNPEDKQLAESVVGTCVQRTYAKCLPQIPRFRDFYRELGEFRSKDEPRAEALAGRLRMLLRNYVVDENGEAGLYSRYFDVHTNFDLNLTSTPDTSPIITFDLIDIKNDESLLVPMTLVTINGLIYNRIVTSDGKDRIVIIDEAWALVKDTKDGQPSPAGEAIELFYREGRKRGASSCFISQNYSDLSGDTVGRAVLGNSPIQYLLVHEPIKANDDAFRSASFSKEKVDTVYNLKTKYGEYSEILMREGDEWGVVRLPSVGLRYWLATTDPKDLKVLKKYMEKYLDGYGMDKRVVIALLAQDYPGGTHGVHGTPMAEQDALLFAERWSDHFRRFSDMIAAGERVPPDFD
jgi:type IV secretory pathway VirB4 component